MVDKGKFAEVLSKFARTMVTDSPMQGIADQLVECIADVLPIMSAGFTLIDPATAFRYVAASDESAFQFEQLQFETKDGPCFVADATGEAISVANLHEDGRFPQFATSALSAGLAAVFTFPVHHDGDRLGAMDLYCDTAGELDPLDMAIAQTLADVTAAYLVMAHARDEARLAAANFKEIALHDTLTGLPNRQLLEDRIEQAAERAGRSHTAAAVLYADLDQFKLVNDAYGHPVGDELLVAVARRLSTLLRSGDTLARISGDEFVFLCEDLGSPDYVEVITDRIADAFSIPFNLANYELTITASIGVAYAGPGDKISPHLVADADKAMYEAKRVRLVP